MESFKPQKNYKNKIIVITGAAHGIGFSLAQRYAACKAKVVVLDVSEKSLEAAKQAIPNAHFFQCDITDRKKVYQIAQEIEKNIGIPDYVFNNAGVVENSTFLDCPDEKLELTMNVNIMGQFWIAKAFLAMMKKKGGHLCQVASAAGLMGVSGLVAYCTSKHAVVGFSKALTQELNDLYPGKFKITTVCPFFINTGLFKGVKSVRLTPMLDQEKIANIIFKSVDEDAEWVLEPFMVKMVPALHALLPTKAFNTITKLFGVNQAMSDIVK